MSGRILAGEIASIYEDGKIIKLEKVRLLEVIGLQEHLEPIYGYRKNPFQFAYVRTDEIVHWENLPDYLKVK